MNSKGRLRAPLAGSEGVEGVRWSEKNAPDEVQV